MLGEFGFCPPDLGRRNKNQKKKSGSGRGVLPGAVEARVRVDGGRAAKERGVRRRRPWWSPGLVVRVAAGATASGAAVDADELVAVDEPAVRERRGARETRHGCLLGPSNGGPCPGGKIESPPLWTT